MSEAKEILRLIPIYLQSKGRALAEYCRVVLRYYGHEQFRAADLMLRQRVFLESPYAINKRFLKLRGEVDVYTYGETPLTTIERICLEAKVTKGDVVLDLGCGPGFTSFWIYFHRHCKVIGIDYIPTFIKWAQAVKGKFGVCEDLLFECGDIRSADFEKATFVYLCGTCLEEEMIAQLALKMQRLPQNARIVTVSYPLSEYAKGFETICEWTDRISWGDAEVYLQRKI